jgi:hypothetical protein
VPTGAVEGGWLPHLLPRNACHALAWHHDLVQVGVLPRLLRRGGVASTCLRIELGSESRTWRRPMPI